MGTGRLLEFDVNLLSLSQLLSCTQASPLARSAGFRVVRGCSSRNFGPEDKALVWAQFTWT